MTDEKPAKFMICKTIPSDLALEKASEEDLWKEHRKLAQEFRLMFRGVLAGNELDTVHVPARNFLDIKAELLNRILEHCTFCEWKCKVDRARGSAKGACRMDATTRVATWFHHFGEEAPLIGRGGSGTVFFAGCPLRCAYCQNWDISQYPLKGERVGGADLAEMMETLRNEEAANINLVGGEPTPNLHTIVGGMRLLRASMPILWNSNMYLTSEAMEILSDLVDIWLPDFKYGNDGCALRLSRAVRYFEVVSRNHRIAYENGDMVIRHLVLPNHFECCTRPVLEWIAANCPRALVNVMEQYHPDYRVPQEPERYREIARMPLWDEIVRARKYAGRLGIAYEQVS
jgi:putative pyruvate formate lyase activating enzyme